MSKRFGFFFKYNYMFVTSVTVSLVRFGVIVSSMSEELTQEVISISMLKDVGITLSENTARIKLFLSNIEELAIISLEWK